jgi:hypothetical protein
MSHFKPFAMNRLVNAVVVLATVPAPLCSNVDMRVQESNGVCFDRATL